MPKDLQGNVDSVTWLAVSGLPGVAGEGIALALGALPQALERSAAELFLPRAIAERHQPPPPTYILAHLRDYATIAWSDAQRVPKPMRAEAKPGRNDPCPCGSGAKFKKCCEGKAAAGSG
ncbi:MAG: SEC-C domain-containing protein [Deltaproteobacteria bacterium]|nr:SEC-C domain-containing protein [Deltaproteobacteria bacterium]